MVEMANLLDGVRETKPTLSYVIVYFPGFL